MAYKQVDCPGKVLNNHPPFDSHNYDYTLKYEFLSRYKFSVAFENQSVTNYTTEKILHAFVAGSIPIYWGNPQVARLFNPKSFINCHDFANFAEVLEWVRAVDRDDVLYARYRSEPPILRESRLYELSSEFLSTELQRIGSGVRFERPVACRALYPVFRWTYFLGEKLRNHFTYYRERLRRLITTEVAQPRGGGPASVTFPLNKRTRAVPRSLPMPVQPCEGVRRRAEQSSDAPGASKSASLKSLEGL